MTPETAFGILAVILVLVLAASTAKVASDKGCSAMLWFIAGVLLPGLALVVALFLDEHWLKSVRGACAGLTLALASGYCGHDFTARGQLRVDNFQ